MSKLKTIDICAEFGYELACSIPYAYWLHKRGELNGVVTCEGMKPFYYFCDNVEEKYKFRRMDNSANGVQNLPNSWVHHNAPANFGRNYDDLTEDERIKTNGWLDYSKWECPPYREYYKDSSLSLPKKYVVISNRYNLEHGDPPVGHFDIECLYKLFEYFKDNGYNVVYKRPKNTEFATDSNELLDLNITANVDGQGLMTDFDLVNHYDNVFLMDDLISKIKRGYNESQLNIFARSSGFVSMGGGSSILCSSFGKPVVIYVNTSSDIRPGYFDENSYFRKLSNAPIYPVVDKKDDIIKRGYRDYSKVYKNIKEVFDRSVN